MRWAAAGKINCRKMITHTVKPEDAPAVYKMIEENKEPFMGIVFDWRSK
jgi:threonine dehydrogenase-like Zn-dependent dehydrogenase